MPLVPDAPTIRDEVTASSKWNGFRDAIRFLQSPPIAELRQASVQSIPNGAGTAVLFDAEDFDSDVDGTGGHSTSVATSRFTARYAGVYELIGGISFEANSTNHRFCWWTVNGIDVNGSQVNTNASTAGIATNIAARPKKVFLAVGDFVELIAFQNSGGALNTSVSVREQPNMSVKWVSR